MKKLLILMLLISVSALAFTACELFGSDDKCENGHTFTSYESDGNATCIADGTKTAKCDNCDVTNTITSTGSALGHTYSVYTSNNNATCTEDGTKTAKCDRCEITDTVADEGTAKGHDLTEWENVKNPTCTERGTKKRSCNDCNFSETADVGATDHSFNLEIYGYQAADGHARRCTVCGEKATVESHTPGSAATETDPQICTVCEYVIVAPLGHTHSFALETKSEVTLKSVADCENAATYYKSCSCGAVSESETFTIGSPLGHDYAAATCTAPKTCKNCPVTDGDPLGHDYAAATCTAPKTCKRCPATEGDALGHDYDEWYVYKQETFLQSGEKRRECKRCDHFESKIVPAKESEHMDPDGWTPVD